MRFLADMGISPATVAFLRGLQHEARHLHEHGLDRLPDAAILEKARSEGAVLLTHDLDFGELVAAGVLSHDFAQALGQIAEAIVFPVVLW